MSSCGLKIVPHCPVEIKKREVFDELFQRRWGTPMTPPNTQQPKAFEKYEDHEQQEQPTLEVEDIVDSTGKLINQQPAYDQIINAGSDKPGKNIGQQYCMV